jgi:transcription elongation factor GreB
MGEFVFCQSGLKLRRWWTRKLRDRSCGQRRRILARRLYANAAGVEREVSIVGTDEVDLDRNHVSWVSPLGRALMQSAEGDKVVLEAPGGRESLTVLEVRYERIAVEPFRKPTGSYAAAKES